MQNTENKREVGKRKKKAGKKKNKRKPLVHALITQQCQSTPIKCNGSPFPHD